jgi:hypothetical protein
VSPPEGKGNTILRFFVKKAYPMLNFGCYQIGKIFLSFYLSGPMYPTSSWNSGATDFTRGNSGLWSGLIFG